MHNKISERDWKKARKLQPELVQRFCRRIFEKVETISAGKEADPRASYHQLYRLIESEDRLIEAMFDDVTRSRIYQKIKLWRAHGLMTDEEFAEFSEETQSIIGRMQY